MGVTVCCTRADLDLTERYGMPAALTSNSKLTVNEGGIFLAVLDGVMSSRYEKYKSVKNDTLIMPWCAVLYLTFQLALLIKKL